MDAPVIIFHPGILHGRIPTALLFKIANERSEFRNYLEHGYIWNVNFPECTLSDCKGILRDRTVSSGMVYRDSYKAVENLGGGGVRLMVEGEHDGNAEPGTDLRAVMDGYVSIGTVNNVGICNGR